MYPFLGWIYVDIVPSPMVEESPINEKFIQHGEVVRFSPYTQLDEFLQQP